MINLGYKHIKHVFPRPCASRSHRELYTAFLLIICCVMPTICLSEKTKGLLGSWISPISSELIVSKV
jgi:hypothetical protein